MQSFGESMSLKLMDRLKYVSNNHRMLQTDDAGNSNEQYNNQQS